MKKLKITFSILAFVGLATLNFTQSETCLVSKALASSSGDCSDSHLDWSYSNLHIGNSDSSSSNGSSSGSSHNCFHGGEGSNSCSISAGLNILGQGVTTGCQVSCYEGYYACCSVQCSCVKI